MCNIYKIKTTGVPQYLSDLIPQTNHFHNTSVVEDGTTFYSRTDLSSIISFNIQYYYDWNVDESKTMLSFRDSLLKTGWPNCVNPLCPCILEIESPFDFFQHCHYFTVMWKIFFNEFLSVDKDSLNQCQNETANLFLYDNQKFKFQQNCRISKSSIRFIIKSEIFNLSII